MSFHTPQAHVGVGSSNYFTPQNSTANASTPRSSSMKSMVTTTPKNVRWPDQQSHEQQISAQPAQNVQSMPSAASGQSSGGPSTPSRPQPSTGNPGTPSTPSIVSAARAVSSSLQQVTSPMRPSPKSSSIALDSVSRPSIGALRGRVKWNAAAWATLLILPGFRFSQEIYWSFADVVLAVLGTSAETKLHAAVLWIKWACLLVFIVNFFEAAIQLYFSAGDASRAPAGFSQPPRPASQTTPASSQSQQQRQTSSAVSPRPSQIRYNPDSPLKSSLEAASRLSDSAQKSYTDRTTNKGIERRLPSGLPTSMTGSATSGSPLAAYLARRRISSQGPGANSIGDDSATGAEGSEDSFEVDRALRALSNSYLRSSSLSRSFGPDDGPDAMSRSASAGLDGRRSQSVHAGR